MYGNVANTMMTGFIVSGVVRIFFWGSKSRESLWIPGQSSSGGLGEKLPEADYIMIVEIYADIDDTLLNQTSIYLPITLICTNCRSVSVLRGPKCSNVATPLSIVSVTNHCNHRPGNRICEMCLLWSD